MRFLEKLSLCQRTVRIARVATHEHMHAARQLKKSQKQVVRSQPATFFLYL